MCCRVREILPIARLLDCSHQMNVGRPGDRTFSIRARIRIRVDHLMKLCDELEPKLRRAEDRASKLVEAVVAAAYDQT
jgi:hypothetical protein